MTPIAELLAELKRTPLVLRRDCPKLDRDAFVAYCRQASKAGDDPFLHWGFGPVMELKADDTAPNYLFTREAVPFHWDGVFFEVPHVLIFQCLEAPLPGSGGETFFCDAEKLYHSLSDDKKARWRDARITYRTEKLAHYGGEATVPLFGLHPIKKTPVVRFAESVSTAKNPVTTSVSGVSDAEGRAIVEYFTNACYSAELCYTHTWLPGDLILADNHALLHGRNAFLQRTPRHIRRIQLK